MQLLFIYIVVRIRTKLVVPIVPERVSCAFELLCESFF